MDEQRAQSLLTAAEEQRKRLRGPDSAVASAAFERMYPELEAALGHFLAHGPAEDGLRLAGALVPFWMASKRIDDGDRWFDRLLRRSEAPEAVRARAVYDHGYLIFWAGHDDRSAALSKQAVDLGREAGAPTVVALALAVLARIALRTDVDEAKRLLLEALEVTDGTDDRDGRSSAMHVLGVAYQMSGELEAARDVMSDRIALGRETGNAYLVAVESANLSMVERQLGDLERAAALSLEALETFHGLGDALAVAWSANGHAAVTAAQGDLERAATLIGFAEAGIERAGGEWPPDERQQYDGTLETLRAGLGPDVLEASRAAGRAMSTESGVAFALAGSSAAAPAP